MFDMNPHELEDAPPSVFIVDEDCIENGKKEDFNECMVALSIIKAGGKNPIVGHHISFWHKGKFYYLKNSKDIHTKISRFDEGEDLKPFIIKADLAPFDLSIPKEG